MHVAFLSFQSFGWICSACVITLQDGLLGNPESDSVQSQVQRLILQACSHENLCQSYIGWCPFW